jgi:phage-Barnase-EndoU-ColicinE5/D-RelE like nuclease2
MRILTDYQGRRIRLTDERMEHIFQHREMERMEQALEQTLRDPERVIQSKSDEIAHLYYRYQSGALFGDK